jgi:hypothetical protein
MTLWQPTWTPNAEVETLDGRLRFRVFEQYPDGTTLVMPEDLLPAVCRTTSYILDRRQITPEPWCRQAQRVAPWPPERIVWRFPGARERRPTPGAWPRPPTAPVKPRSAWACGGAGAAVHQLR